MKLDPVLLIAYHDADYVVFTDHDRLILRVNQLNADFALLMQQQQAHSFAFISACNPRSHKHPDDANLMRHQHFIARLQQENYPYLEGVGQSRDQSWQERSVLIWNISSEQALHWARYLEQNAFLWGQADAIPTLHLCEQ